MVNLTHQSFDPFFCTVKVVPRHLKDFGLLKITVRLVERCYSAVQLRYLPILLCQLSLKLTVSVLQVLIEVHQLAQLQFELVNKQSIVIGHDLKRISYSYLSAKILKKRCIRQYGTHIIFRVSLAVPEHLACSLQILLPAGLLLGQEHHVERVVRHPLLAETQMLLVLAYAEYRLVA